MLCAKDVGGNEMDLAYIRKCVVLPVSKQNPTGERLVDDPNLEFIEEQLIKVGSLSHATVKWDEVEHSVLNLLRNKSKDIKLLVYLLQCLLNQVTPERFIISFQAMTDFIDCYWESSFPVSGEKGTASRKKYLDLMLQRISLVIEKLDFAQFDQQQRSSLNDGVNRWFEAIEEKQPANTIVSAVVDSVVRGLKRAEQPQIQKTQVQPPQEMDSSIKQVSQDTADENSTKKTVLKLASTLSEQEFGAELSIRLRRYAIWGMIFTHPDHQPDGETLLRAMPAERIKEYQEQLRFPSMSLWNKIEHSLTLAPFWFSGQFMSFSVAQSIGKPDWAIAIADETHRFLQRMPFLHELKFKGGEPFVTDEVRAWLNKYSFSNESQIQGDWSERRREAYLLANDKGIAVALDMVNGGINSAQSYKDQFYWRLLSADLLRDNHLGGIAKSQYQSLYQQLKNMDISNWEAGLLEQLEKHSTSE